MEMSTKYKRENQLIKMNELQLLLLRGSQPFQAQTNLRKNLIQFNCTYYNSHWTYNNLSLCLLC